MAASLQTILVTILLYLACISTGAALMRLARIESDSALERLLGAAALGIVVLIFAVFGLGLAGALTPAAGWALALIMLAVGCPRLPALFSDVLKGAARLRRDLGFEAAALGAVILVFGALVLFCALCPPTAYDSLVYHMAWPRESVRSGGLAVMPTVIRSFFPAGMGMMYIQGLLLDSDRMAGVIHLGLGILSMLAVYRLAAGRVSPRAGLWAAAIFFSLRNVHNVAGREFVEMGVVFFTLVAVMFLERYVRAGRFRLLAFGGIMAGMTLFMKYNSAVIPVVLGMWLLAASRREGPAAMLWRPLVFGLIALLPVAPWLARNHAITGTPTFPLLVSRFGDRWVSQEMSPMEYGAFDAGQLGRLVTLPWNVTMHGYTMSNFRTPLSFLFLALLPGLLLLRPPPEGVTRLLGFGLGIAALTWLGKMNVVRYLLPAAALFSAVLGFVVVGAEGRSRLLGAAVKGLVILNFIYAALGLSFGETNFRVDAQVALGFMTRDQYVAHGAISAFHLEAGRMLPSDARVAGDPLLMFGYYLERPFVLTNMAQQGYFEWGRYSAPEEFLADLERERITHFALMSGFLTPGHCGKVFFKEFAGRCVVWDLFAQRYLRVIHRSDGFALAEVDYAGWE